MYYTLYTVKSKHILSKWGNAQNSGGKQGQKWRQILIFNKTLQEIFELESCQARQRPQGIMEIYGQGLKQWGAMRVRFSRRRASAYRVLLNRNATAFLNRKALSAKALRCEKSSTLNAEILSFIKAENAGGLAPVKDDNAEKGQKIKFKAGLHGVPLLKTRHGAIPAEKN